MNLMLIAEFIAKSDLKKASMAVYFWTTLLLMKWKLPTSIGDGIFSDICIIIIVAAFAGNVLTHFIRGRYPAKGSPEEPNPGGKPNADPQAAPIVPAK